MEIIVLGSGTAIPIDGHSPAGVIVIHKGSPVLLDIGPGTLSRLYLANVTCDQINTLFLSHLHPDHTLDLAALMQVFESAPNAQRTKPFSIIGCRGTQDFVNGLLSLYPEITPHTYTLNIREIYRDEFLIDDLRIQTAPTGHTPDSVAYRFQVTDHSMVYAGDASSQGDLVTLADGADVLICECSFPAGWNSPDHLNADSVGALASQAGVKTLVITHRYPPAFAVDLSSQIRHHFKGELKLAMDGMRISL